MEKQEKDLLRKSRSNTDKRLVISRLHTMRKCLIPGKGFGGVACDRSAGRVMRVITRYLRLALPCDARYYLMAEGGRFIPGKAEVLPRE